MKFKPFKQNKNKEQKAEEKRREEIIRNLRDLLMANCENAQDLYTRVDVVIHQIDAKGAKRLEDYKTSMGQERFGDWNLVAQDGKGKEVEQMVIDLFKDETVMVAETIMDTWKKIHDAFARKDLLERKPSEFKIEFK